MIKPKSATLLYVAELQLMIRREIIPKGKSAGFMIFKDMPHDAE
jgi:hypothetical protein